MLFSFGQGSDWFGNVESIYITCSKGMVRYRVEITNFPEGQNSECYIKVNI